MNVCPHPGFCRTRTAGPCEICRGKKDTYNATAVAEPNDFDEPAQNRAARRKQQRKGGRGK